MINLMFIIVSESSFHWTKKKCLAIFLNLYHPCRNSPNRHVSFGATYSPGVAMGTPTANAKTNSLVAHASLQGKHFDVSRLL